MNQKQIPTRIAAAQELPVLLMNTSIKKPPLVIDGTTAENLPGATEEVNPDEQ